MAFSFHDPATYLFLASDESRFVTGANIVVEGGHLTGPGHPAQAMDILRSALERV